MKRRAFIDREGKARLSEMSRTENLEEKLSAFGNGFHAYPVNADSFDLAGPRDHRPDGLRTGIRTPLGPPDTHQMASADRLIRKKMLELQHSPRVI